MECGSTICQAQEIAKGKSVQAAGASVLRSFRGMESAYSHLCMRPVCNAVPGRDHFPHSHSISHSLYTNICAYYSTSDRYAPPALALSTRKKKFRAGKKEAASEEKKTSLRGGGNKLAGREKVTIARQANTRYTRNRVGEPAFHHLLPSISGNACQ